MVTLKELVDMQQFTSKNDAEIIVDWFVRNGFESEGISMIAKISKSKMDKDEQQLNHIRSNSACPTSFYYSKPYPKESAVIFDYLTRAMQLGFDLNDERYAESLDKLKDIVPNMNKPPMIWSDLYDYLHVKGIYFKNEQSK